MKVTKPKNASSIIYSNQKTHNESSSIGESTIEKIQHDVPSTIVKPNSPDAEFYGIHNELGNRINKSTEYDQNLNSNETLIMANKTKDIYTIFSVDRLRLKSFELKRTFDYVMHNPIETLKNKQFVFSINSGLFIEVISKDSLTDKHNLGWSLGLSIRNSKVSLKLGYKNYGVERSTTSPPNTYNIVDINFVNPYERPNTTSIEYHNYLLDIALGYRLFSVNRLDWNLNAGIQARKISSGKIKFKYGSPYSPFVIETDLLNQQFQLSAVRFGSSINLALYKPLGLSLDYSLVIPFEVETIKWPKRHQFELGIIYHLN